MDGIEEISPSFASLTGLLSKVINHYFVQGQDNYSLNHSHLYHPQRIYFNIKYR